MAPLHSMGHALCIGSLHPARLHHHSRGGHYCGLRISVAHPGVALSVAHMGLLRFRLHSDCSLQRALSCGCNGDLWRVLFRVANGANGLSAVVLLSEPAGFREGLLSSRAGLWALAV